MNSILKQRYPFIDMAKGMLIVCLVFHHIVSIARKEISVDNMMYITKIDVLFVPYFMQAFFFITGFCSSFNKKFSSFLITNIKTLLFPLLFFSVLTQLIDWLLWDDEFLYVTVFGKKFFFVIELFWFLSSLFIAKHMMFAINFLFKNWFVQLLVILIPFFLAVNLNDQAFHSYNYFHWHNAFVNLFFLWIGFWVRKKDLLCYCFRCKFSMAILYILGIIFFILCNKNIPYYTHVPHFTIKDTFAFIYFSLIGTCMIIQIAKDLPSNKYLIFLGKNTIVVYGIHFSVLSVVVFFCGYLFSPQNYVEGTLYYIIVGLISLFCSYLFCNLFQRAPFTYFLGRF